MPSLDMIDAFVGLFFVYLTLSLIVTAFGESWSASRNLRGKTLEACITNVLGEKLALDFYSSNQISALKTPTTLSKKNKRVPSYIPDHIFSSTLVDCLLDGKLQELRVNPEKFQTALKAALEKKEIDKVTRAALLDFWSAADFNVITFFDSINAWFNDITDRLSGSFKRRISRRLFIIGFIVAFAMNANSISMFKKLTDDPALRSQYFVKAVQLADSGKPETLEDICGSETDCSPADVAKKQALEIMPLVGWTANTPPLAKLNGEAIDKSASTSTNEADKSSSDSLQENQTRFVDSPWFLWLYSILGWVLTAGALSLGAPFWFNLLQKLVKIRGSVQAIPSTSGEGLVETNAKGDSPATQATAINLEDFSSFEHNSLNFNQTNALWLARASNLAYQERQVVQETAQQWGVVGSLHEGSEGTQFITLETPKLLVLSFRGTETNEPKDFLVDTNAILVKPEWSSEEGVEVHKGFNQALAASWTKIETVINPAIAENKPIWLCGHSLGGALAVLAAHRLIKQGVQIDGARKKPSLGALYTYGQPRCGNKAFAESLESALSNRYFRSVNNSDIVPLIPPPVKSYRHTGRVAYFNEFGDFVLDPPLWYRALDKVELTTDAIKAKGREAVGDHSMSGYVKLYRELFR